MTTANPSETSSASSQLTSAQRAPRRIWETVVVLAVFVALSARLFALISRYAVNVFFMDQWDFNEATLFQKHSLWEMFRWQHGPHRQGVGAIVAYLIEPRFHWDSRSESFLIWIIVVLATFCALFLKIRLFGTVTIFDICIPLILLTPLQYESLFITANLAHGPLPLLLVLFYCLAWSIHEISLRYALILLLNFAAIHTGFGFFLGLITPIVLSADYWFNLRHRSRAAILFVLCLLLSLLALASFFVRYRYDSSVDCQPNLVQSPASYAQFLFLMFANLFGVKGTSLLPLLIGALALAAILTALIISVRALPQQNSCEKHYVAAILLAFSLLFAANAAYGRACLGPQVAQVSRYVIYLEIGLLGLYFFLIALPASPFRRGLLLILAASLAGTIPLRKEDKSIIRFVSAAKRNWKACYLQVEDIRGCNHAVGYGVYPNTDRNLKGKLEFLKQTKQNLYWSQ